MFLWFATHKHDGETKELKTPSFTLETFIYIFFCQLNNEHRAYGMQYKNEELLVKMLKMARC